MQTLRIICIVSTGILASQLEQPVFASDFKLLENLSSACSARPQSTEQYR
jgi:hypothetical protein